MMSTVRLAIVALAIALFLAGWGVDGKDIGADGSIPFGPDTWEAPLKQTTLVLTTTDVVHFTWSGTALHSIVQFTSEDAFNSCDFSGTVYTLNVPTKTGDFVLGPSHPRTLLLADGSSTNCEKGQKLKVVVQGAAANPPPSSPPSPAPCPTIKLPRTCGTFPQCVWHSVRHKCIKRIRTGR